MIVVAAGNDGYRGSVASYIRSPGAAIVRGSLLLLAQTPAYRNRIVVVGGTQDGGSLWNEGNFFTGAMDLAAPASNVTVLDRWPGGAAVPVTLSSGTSLAAPMVAGVAGLLQAMDSTLTPSEIKDFILRGARVRRINLATGDSVPANPVSGASETIYQLDAYGALTLLSQERPRTPICGFPVAVRGDEIVLERPAGREALTVPGATFLAAPSLAQGGRLIAVSDDQGFVDVLDHRGAIRQTLAAPIIERRFLERDTIDVLYSLAPQGGFRPLFRYQPSRAGIPSEYNPWAIAVSSAPEAVSAGNFYEFSATGDSIALHTVSPAGISGAGNNVTRWGWDLVSVTAGTTMQIREWMVEGSGGQYCTGDCVEHDLSQAQWSHGGQHLALLSLRTQRDTGDSGIPFAPALRAGSGTANAFGDITDYRTSVVLRTPAVQTETTVEGLWLLHPRFLPDDSVMTFRERSISPTCEATTRPFASFSLWRKASSVGVEECDPGSVDFSLPRLLTIPAAGGSESASSRPGRLLRQSQPTGQARRRVLDYLRRRPTRAWVN